MLIMSAVLVKRSIHLVWFFENYGSTSTIIFNHEIIYVTNPIDIYLPDTYNSTI